MPRRYACKHPTCGRPTFNELCADHAGYNPRKTRDARPDVRAKRNARPARLIYQSAAWRRLRRIVLDRDDVCMICYQPPIETDPLTCGHLTPIASGQPETYDPDHYQSEHRSCNARKGAR